MECMQQARDEYRGRKREIVSSSFAVEEKLDAGRDALRSMRKAAATIFRETKAQPFGEWLHDQEDVRDRAAQTSSRFRSRVSTAVGAGSPVTGSSRGRSRRLVARDAGQQIER